MGKGFGKGLIWRFRLAGTGLLYGTRFVMFKGRVALDAPDARRNKDARNILSLEFGVGKGEYVGPCIVKGHYSLASWTGIKI